MEEPCFCDCGRLFDLEDGNPCGVCGKIFCKECVVQPFDSCSVCDGGFIEDD